MVRRYALLQGRGGGPCPVVRVRDRTPEEGRRVAARYFSRCWPWLWKRGARVVQMDPSAPARERLLYTDRLHTHSGGEHDGE